MNVFMIQFDRSCGDKKNKKKMESIGPLLATQRPFKVFTNDLENRGHWGHANFGRGRGKLKLHSFINIPLRDIKVHLNGR